MESNHLLLSVSPCLKPSHSKLPFPLLSCKSIHKVQRTGNLCLDKKFKTLNSQTRARLNDFSVRAAEIDNADVSASRDDDQMVKTLQLGSMFSLWYFLNIYFTIYNKQLSSLSLLAMGHFMGNLLTNISLGKVAVSFTHTIKAMEPFFTVILAVLFLGERPDFLVVSSLVPIVGGVALASFTEASFNWIGFGSAMASNVANQGRNVYSKVVMAKEEETLDNINIFSVMTISSFIFLVPIAILIDGVKLSPSYLQHAASQGLNLREFWIRSLLAGFCFHTYQQVSYMILQMVSPVTHSVGSSFKRVVVIVSSVIFFKIPVSPINALETGIALAGVFLYSRAKRIKTKAKK